MKLCLDFLVQDWLAPSTGYEGQDFRKDSCHETQKNKKQKENEKMNKKIMKNKKGFTLIELIVVMAVIGILVMLAAPRFIGYTKDASVSAMKADIKVLESVSLVYNIENEAWPVVDADEITDGLQAIAAGTYAELETASGVTDFYEIDFALIGDQVKSLKNDASEYVMDAEGNVYHTAGVEDRGGNIHFATDLEVVPAAG